FGDLVTKLARHQRRRVAVDQLVDRREDAALDQLANDIRRVDRQQLRQLLDRDRPRQLDRATLARVEHLDLRRNAAAVTARRLARPAPAAGAAPTPCHALLLRSSSRARPERCSQLRRERCLQRPAQGALLHGIHGARALAAEIGSPACEPPALVDHHPSVRCPNDAEQVALRLARAAGDARPRRQASRAGHRRGRPRYDDTSPVVAPALALGARFAFGSAVAGWVAAVFGVVFFALVFADPFLDSAESAAAASTVRFGLAAFPAIPSALASTGASVGSVSTFFVLVARFGFGASSAAPSAARGSSAARAAGACAARASACAAAFASATETSLRMSMRQPVRRAASRAFWPSRPIARDSI